ncbi:MAG: hypothetical protein ABIJ40_06745 [Bacteroidota bacterium]
MFRLFNFIDSNYDKNTACLFKKVVEREYFRNKITTYLNKLITKNKDICIHPTSIFLKVWDMENGVEHNDFDYCMNISISIDGHFFPNRKPPKKG